MNGHLVCAGVMLTLVVHAFPLQAGVEIATDRADALYELGDTAVFTVKVTDDAGLMKTGEVVAVVDNFGPQVLVTNVIRLAEANPFVVSASRSDPGFLRLTVSGNGKPVVWGVGYRPERIRAVTRTPEDFDAFWQAARRRLAERVPLDAKVVPVPERSRPGYDFYRISFATFKRRVYGYMSVPTDRSKAPYPVEVQIAAAGFGNWTNIGAGGDDRISVFFSVYPFEPHWDWKTLGLKAAYNALNSAYDAVYECGNYSVAGAGTSREAYFYYPVILGIDRAIDWLAARPDVDPTRIWYQGTSQGGGMGLAVVGLNRHFTRAAFFVPAITDTLAGQAGRQSGWPRPVEGLRGAEAKRVAAEVMPYFDGASFATRISCPVRMALGFADCVCAPHCTWAAYNAIASEDKDVVCGVGMGHDCRREFYDRIGTWLRTGEWVLQDASVK